MRPRIANQDGGRRGRGGRGEGIVRIAKRGRRRGQTGDEAMPPSLSKDAKARRTDMKREEAAGGRRVSGIGEKERDRARAGRGGSDGGKAEARVAGSRSFAGSHLHSVRPYLY